MKLTDEDREALLAAVIRDADMAVGLDLPAVEAIVARHVTAALNEIAAEVEVAAEVRNFPKANVLTVGERSGLLMAAHHLRTAAKNSAP